MKQFSQTPFSPQLRCPNCPSPTGLTQGVEFRVTRDDSHPWHQHDRYFDYHWPKLRRTRSLDRVFAIAEHDPAFYGMEYDG